MPCLPVLGVNMTKTERSQQMIKRILLGLAVLFLWANMAYATYYYKVSAAECLAISGPLTPARCIAWGTTGGPRFFRFTGSVWVEDSINAGMVFPSAGIPLSTGSAWGNSYTAGTSANNLLQLDSLGRIPAVDASLLSAGSLSVASALPDGTTATTQIQGDNSTKVATTAHVYAGLSGKQNTLTNPVTGTGTQYQITYWSGTNDVSAVGSLGTIGQVLTSNGPGTPSSFQNPTTEVQDEVFSAANFDGDTTHGVSQDDFYDRWHIFDSNDNGSFTDELWYPSTSVAPTSAHYVTTQSETGLEYEFSLGTLGSGILKQTVTNSVSVVSVAEGGTDYLRPTTDVNNTPIENELAKPVSSGWAFSHVGASDPHTVYMLESNIGTGSGNYPQLDSSGQLTVPTTSSSGSVKSPDTSGITTVTGPAAGTTRVKTVRDANDTILELGGNYTPSGTWNWGTATVTWPMFNQNTSGTAGGLSGQYLDWNASTGGTSIANKPTIPTAASLSVDDLITLTGVAEGSTSLGTFTGSLFTDSLTVKAILQETETAIEAVPAQTSGYVASWWAAVGPTKASQTDMLAVQSTVNALSSYFPACNDGECEEITYNNLVDEPAGAVGKFSEYTFEGDRYFSRNGDGYKFITAENFTSFLSDSRATCGAVTILGTYSVPITANPYSLTAANAYGFILRYGATGAVNLPAGVAGMNGCIYNHGAYTVTIYPNASEVVIRDGTAQTGGFSFTLSSGAGNYVCMEHDGTAWSTLGFKGTLAQGELMP